MSLAGWLNTGKRIPPYLGCSNERKESETEVPPEAEGFAPAT